MRLWMLASTVALLAAGTSASDQSSAGQTLVAGLKQGGHVIVMRHARSPSDLPTAETAVADNVTRERQLDERGRLTAAAMGDAIRSLGIPLEAVLTSPAYRARQTATLARWIALVTADLGDIGQAMEPASRTEVLYLRNLVRRRPDRGNTVAITHSPNVAGAFPEAGTVAEGEALIFLPDGQGGTRLIGRVTIEEWPLLRP